MLIETTELTLGHVGLGTLSEPAALALFATAQAHELTAGTGGTLDEIVDAEGVPLYPAYFWLHLTVPPTARLERHRLWRRVSVGVDVRRFGRLVLDSTYVLGGDREVPPCVDEWHDGRFVSMRAASLFVVDDGSPEPRPSAPRDGAMADLRVLARGPAAVDGYRRMRGRGTFGRDAWPFQTTAPIAHPAIAGRDGAAARNLMFATYVAIMDAAESVLLGGAGGWPALPAAMLDHRSALEREVFFLGHTRPGHTVLTDVRARVVPCAPDLLGAERDVVPAAELEVRAELYEAGSHTLLAVGRARKLLAIPRARASLIADVERWVAPARCLAEV